MDLTLKTVGWHCAHANLPDAQSLIDLSQIRFFYPFGLVYLGMFLRYFSASGTQFVVRMPRDRTARLYLARQNFWERFNFDPETVASEKLYRWTTSTSLNNIVDIEKNLWVAEELGGLVENILRTNGVRLPPSEIGEIVTELVQNFVEHADRTFAAFLVQYYPRHHQLRIAIGDCGRGIRKNLSSVPQYAWLANCSHSEAALKAFEAGVSSKKGGGGTGFSEILDGVQKFGGELRLASGDEWITVDKDSMADTGKMGVDLPGVQIELIIPERQ